MGMIRLQSDILDGSERTKCIHGVKEKRTNETEALVLATKIVVVKMAVTHTSGDDSRQLKCDSYERCPFILWAGIAKRPKRAQTK